MESFEPPQPSSMTTSERLSKWSVFAIYGGVFLLAGLGFLSYLMFWRLAPAANHLVQQDGLVLPELDLEAFSLKDLKDATKNFSRFTRVGKGGFGEVYKGQLTDGRSVAVKCSKVKEVSKRDSLFNKELKTQAKAHHGNVVNLISYCIDKNQRILVFEHMARKSLYHHLHPTLCQTKSQLFLSWRPRITVLLDAARGINYLHQEANPRIIHHDIKSPNILIDENWVGKISDFGGALIVPAPGTHTEVAIDQLVGTVGYFRPVEIKTGQTHITIDISDDIYSFGVVICEVLTGKKAVKLRKEDLLGEAKCENIIDKRLAKPVGKQVIALQRVMQMAKYCLKAQEDTSQMSIVVAGLQTALTLFDE